jgi:hypothetical protein
MIQFAIEEEDETVDALMIQFAIQEEDETVDAFVST